jgi:hypothetical protein
MPWPQHARTLVARRAAITLDFCDGARRTRTADLLGAIYNRLRNATSQQGANPHNYAGTGIVRYVTLCPVMGAFDDQIDDHFLRRMLAR